MLIAFVCPEKAVKSKISVWREKMCSTTLQSPGNVLEKNTGEPNISSTFDQKYVHACLASPAPFTVVFHGFF